MSKFKEVRLHVEFNRYPAKAICQFAARELVDLIIITTREKNTFSPDLIGSVTEEVVRKAPCAVMVMRKGKYRANYSLENGGNREKMQRINVPIYGCHRVFHSDCKEEYIK